MAERKKSTRITDEYTSSANLHLITIHLRLILFYFHIIFCKHCSIKLGSLLHLHFCVMLNYNNKVMSFSWLTYFVTYIFIFTFISILSCLFTSDILGTYRISININELPANKTSYNDSYKMVPSCYKKQNLFLFSFLCLHA